MLYIRRIIQYEIAGERQDTSEMQNLFFSTGEGDTIAQDSRCKSSLSEAVTFWLDSFRCPFASALLRNILSRTMFKNDIINRPYGAQDSLLHKKIQLLGSILVSIFRLVQKLRKCNLGSHETKWVGGEGSPFRS